MRDRDRASKRVRARCRKRIKFPNYGAIRNFQVFIKIVVTSLKLLILISERTTEKSNLEVWVRGMDWMQILGLDFENQGIAPRTRDDFFF